MKSTRAQIDHERERRGRPAVTVRQAADNIAIEKGLDNLAQLVGNKLQQNAGARGELFSLIASGEAIGFVGAGLSMPLEYPSWAALLEELEGKAAILAPLVIPDEIRSDALLCADTIKEHFEKHGGLGEYHGTLGRRFANPTSGQNCTETHKLLARLPFKAFATTNYEDCMECGLQAASSDPLGDPSVTIKMDGRDRHRASLFLRSLVDGKGGSRYVVHLHGRHDDTENIVLTMKDYVRAYGYSPLTAQVEQVTLHRNLAWALFATRRMVFVGCSMNDPYVTVLLNVVARDLRELLEKNHFVVLPLSPANVAGSDNVEGQFRRRGIQVVYYDNSDDRHTGLEQLLREAAIRAQAANPSEPTAKPSAAGNESAPAAVKGGGIPAKADWMDKVSEENLPQFDSP